MYSRATLQAAGQHVFCDPGIGDVNFGVLKQHSFQLLSRRAVPCGRIACSFVPAAGID